MENEEVPTLVDIIKATHDRELGARDSLLYADLVAKYTEISKLRYDDIGHVFVICRHRCPDVLLDIYGVTRGVEDVRLPHHVQYADRQAAARAINQFHANETANCPANHISMPTKFAVLTAFEWYTYRVKVLEKIIRVIDVLES